MARTTRFVVLLLVFTSSIHLAAYSVLTHEEVVDLAWKEILPLLQKRFPGASPDDIRRAHAFAYGGCVIQDMGYYPFGSKDFSDLVHYVRSGDFVQALLEESTDLNEFAFALGALAHYSADTSGHPFINHAVALRFPKLRARYGESVTYEDDPKAHIRTEFGFDVAQVAKGRYAPDSYHDFIGFEISKPLLERAFRRTYGMELGDVFTSVDLAVGTFRRSISKIIPEMTKAALLTHRVQLAREIPNFNEKKFVYNLKRADYERNWGRDYRRPGMGARIIAFLFKLVPKVGPFKAIAFETPTQQTENLYFKSVNETVEDYRASLRQVGSGTLRLPNLDFDTGKQTVPGEYELTDHAFAGLLHRLAQHNFDHITPDLRNELLAFYANPKAAAAARRDKNKWQQTEHEIEQLRSSTPVLAAMPENN